MKKSINFKLLICLIILFLCNSKKLFSIRWNRSGMRNTKGWRWTYKYSNVKNTGTSDYLRCLIILYYISRIITTSGYKLQWKTHFKLKARDLSIHISGTNLGHLIDSFSWKSEWSFAWQDIMTTLSRISSWNVNGTIWCDRWWDYRLHFKKFFVLPPDSLPRLWNTKSIRS